MPGYITGKGNRKLKDFKVVWIREIKHRALPGSPRADGLEMCWRSG